MRLSRAVTVGFAALVLTAALPAGAAEADTLSGAGSTLVAPLVAEWGVAFGVFNGTSVGYSEVGSQAGIRDLAGGAIDFAASDAPLSAAGATACKGCVQIPWSLSAIGIGYHLSGMREPLFLTPSLLAQIYLGQITRWNDRRLRALNPHGSLPALKITPIYVGSSGETYTFTTYLSKENSTWRARVGSGFDVAFSSGVPAASDAAATALLKSTSGAIAYVGAPFLVANRLPAAAVENAAGRFEFPNLSEIESAGKAVKHVPADNSLQIVAPPSSAPSAYPISTFTYVVVTTNTTKKSKIGYALGALEGGATI
jgi:phosphate transport system substrate-binding protein